MIKTRLIISILIIFIATNIYPAEKSKPLLNQPLTIDRILKAEKNDNDYRNLTGIINKIDDIYGRLYENLKENKKLVIFFDPAHGKLPDGRWQGGNATGRLSCTNAPEEYYSVKISRALYRLLRKNPFIDIQSTDDYMKVLNGTSDTYNNIPFPKTVEIAQKAGSFIILSEHLNNVSMFHKADGRVNLYGLHVTRNNYGQKILRYVPVIYEGFLTLYNKLDTSGFSRLYALKLKNRLTSLGLKPNTWGKGAVGDDRFSYFVDFPVSIIYETGFISNPEEEKKLRDPDYISNIVKVQYETLIENIRSTFGVDISGDQPQKNDIPVHQRLELLKLGRLAVYYLKTGNTKKSIYTINLMNSRYGKTGYRHYISHFTSIKSSLVTAEKLYSLGIRNKRLAVHYRKKKNYKKSRNFSMLSMRYFRRAKRYTYKPVFLAYKMKYSKELNQRYRIVEPGKNLAKRKYTPIKKNIVLDRKPAARWTPVILPINSDQTIEDAIMQALSPDKKTLEKLVESFKNASITRWVKSRYYSKKKKRWVTSWKKNTRKVKFSKGIYLVKLDRNLKVIKADRVNSVILSSSRYQNQQYLNNSYFSNSIMIKSL